jgi:enoyl-CoA hydratase/carnithine racemase
VKETAIGIVADLGTLHRIVKRCSNSMAYYMALSAEPINAQQALQSGLASHTFADHARLLGEGRRVAASIAALSPLTVQGTKRVMQRSSTMDSRAALDYVALWNSSFLRSPDLHEAIGAFVEKRRPVFKCNL